MGSHQATVVAGFADGRQTIFSLLVKQSFRIENGKPLIRLEETAPFLRTDMHHDPGSPETSSVSQEAETMAYKPMTDFVVTGQAYAPDGRPATAVTVGVEIDGRAKLLRVSGDRLARHRARADPLVGEPKPFATMPLRYERAYGGTDILSRPGKPFPYPRNPIGRGLAVLNTPDAINNLRIPNIEAPDDLLSPERIVLGDEWAWNRQPMAQGFGWFGKTWYPRCSFVGAFPGHVLANEPMREAAMGLVPSGQIALSRQFRLPSYDPRFANGASLGLAIKDPSPNALIRLARLTLEGMLSFQLPGPPPALMLDIGLGETALVPALHTVAIDVEQRRADLIWRGAHPYPGPDWLPEMRRMRHEIVWS